MKIILQTIALAALCLNFTSKAQSQTNDIKPLKIGDSIPEGLWNLPLQVANHPEGKQTITLKAYKGKLIILDFWTRYCGSCIRFLPKLDSLKDIYKERMETLPVSDFADRPALGQMLKKHRLKLNMPVLLHNQALIDYFPHQSVSHLIWITANGRVAAITGSDYVDAPNIDLILSEKANHWPVKEDGARLKPGIPLVTLNTSASFLRPLLYYSALTAGVSGTHPGNGSKRDSLNHVEVTTYYNRSLLDLCQMAVDYRTGAADAEIVYRVKDRSRYTKPDSSYYDQWRRAGTYCYTISLPTRSGPAKTREIIQADLKRWLGIMGIAASKLANGKYLIEETEQTLSAQP